MDGVIVNFVEGACNKLGRPNPYYDPAGQVVDTARGEFNVWKLLDVPIEVMLGGLTAEDWENLEPMPDAFDILTLVEDYFGKKNVCILSNPMAHPSVVADVMGAKHRCIKQHFPFYWNRFLFGPQKEFCANPNHVLIDDYDKNVDDFTKHGGKACLIPRPWNSASHKDTVDTLRDFLETL